MTPEHRWTCLGVLPHVPPCGAHGTTDTEAADHTKQTQHSTSSGPARGVEAMRRAFGGDR